MKIRTLVAGLMVIGASAAAAPVLAEELVKPIQPPKQINLGKAELGKKLFFDPRLSKSGVISCNTCHNLSRGGADNVQFSIGHRWALAPVNSPTVLNSVLNVAQFWDGRAADLKEQAKGPIQAAGEMAMPHEIAVEVIASIPGYQREFNLVYGAPGVSIGKIAEAIAEFEKTLKTPNSRFDQWLLGKKDALTADEQAGWTLFKNSGCVACHNGEALGGSSFQKMGLVEPYRSASPEDATKGRAGVTGKDADRFNFKVPTLRNVEMTYPYFHDGAVWTLKEAVDIMGRLQLGRRYTDKENAQIVAFLNTLTGEQPRIVLPILPPSTDRTPRPNPK